MNKFRISGYMTLEETYPQALAFLETNKGSDIIFEINSCGGDLSGLEHLCSIIESREKMSYAHIVGEACSAGLWLASAFDHVIASPNCQIGCVGVIQFDPSFYKGENFIVSEQTPKKNEYTKEEVQDSINKAAERFISYIEKKRGVTRGDWSDGRIFSSSDALTFGLIDSILTGEFAIADVKKKTPAIELAAAASNCRGLRAEKPKSNIFEKTAKKIISFAKNTGGEKVFRRKQKATSVIIDDSLLPEGQDGEEITVDLIKSQFPEIYDAIKAEVVAEIEKTNSEIEEVMESASAESKEDDEVKTAAAAVRSGKLPLLNLALAINKANAKHFAAAASKPKSVARRVEGDGQLVQYVNSIAKMRGGK